jgi:peptidoglycan/xylan/chitin deacetylase (PgdA/CDA1 family)
MHMIWLLLSRRAVAALAAALIVSGAAGLTSHAAPATARVALTFDDLPAHGPLPPGVTRVEVAQRVIAALRGHRAPAVYGFVNAGQLQKRPEDAEVLRLWRGAGFLLGSHTLTHMDLDRNPAEAFEQDVRANEPVLEALMGHEDWRWLRFPFLHEGDTRDKHRRIRTFLSDRGYRTAQVTLNFDDYAYNEPYARCVSANDTSGLDQLKQSYRTRAAESLVRGQQAARRLFGRDIPHVLLLHIGAFETVMLPDLLDLLAARGFVLSTLRDAQNDEAYAQDPNLDSTWDGTLLEQMLRARGVSGPQSPDPVFEMLTSLCRER